MRALLVEFYTTVVAECDSIGWIFMPRWWQSVRALLVEFYATVALTVEFYATVVAGRAWWHYWLSFMPRWWQGVRGPSPCHGCGRA